MSQDTSSQTETTPLLSSQKKIDVDIYTKEHEKCLQDSIRSAYFMVAFYFLSAMLDACRSYVWLLFAYRLTDNSFNIAIVLCFTWIVTAIGSFTLGNLANTYSYEGVLAPITFCCFIFCLLEGFAVNFPMFAVGSMGVHFFYGGYYPICLAYIAHLVPRKYNTKYTVIGVQGGQWGKVVGALITFLIIYQIFENNYRSVFIFTSVISLIQAVSVQIFLRGTEANLRERQRAFIVFYNSAEIKNSPLAEEENQFPLAIETQRSTFASKLKCPSVPIPIWILLTCCWLGGAMFWAGEACLVRFYLLFLEHTYPNATCPVCYGLSQISLQNLGIVIGLPLCSYLYGKFLETQGKYSKPYNTTYFCYFGGYIITPVICYIIIHMTDKLNIEAYFYLTPLLGLSLGIGIYFQAVLEQIVMPTKNSGMFYSVAIFFINIGRAICSFTLGITWQTNDEMIFIFIYYLAIGNLVVTLVYVVIQKLWVNDINQYYISVADSNFDKALEEEDENV